ncbi:MAG: hypothetical protein IAE81_22110, partial [Caldilineaceae bacterium]|nr:hypothetical protein [Caldilineaceae bacterium]
MTAQATFHSLLDDSVQPIEVASRQPAYRQAVRWRPQAWLLAWLLAVVALLGLAPAARAAQQVDVPGPAGSGEFGKTITMLPNGNVVVTDPSYDIPNGAADVGAVYLYDGATHTMISMLTGSTA